MVTMATLPPAKELKIQVVSWQNEIRTLDVLKSPTWKIPGSAHGRTGRERERERERERVEYLGSGFRRVLKPCTVSA